MGIGEARGMTLPVGECGDVVGFSGHGRLGFGNQVSAKIEKVEDMLRERQRIGWRFAPSFFPGLKACASTRLSRFARVVMSGLKP